jgi:hypothetical protein
MALPGNEPYNLSGSCRGSSLASLESRRLNPTMGRQWLRLVRWVTLVAFLIANGPATGTSFFSSLHSAGRTPSGCCCGTGWTLQGCAASHDVSSTCDQCRTKSGQPALAKTSPDSPCQEDGLPCPCPGGCMYCNLAKAPCCPSVASVPLPALCLEQSSPATLPPYSPPFCGRLTRPPRA